MDHLKSQKSKVKMQMVNGKSGKSQATNHSIIQSFNQ